MKNFSTGVPTKSGNYLLYHKKSKLYELNYISVEKFGVFVFDYPTCAASVPIEEDWDNIEWLKLK